MDIGILEPVELTEESMEVMDTVASDVDLVSAVVWDTEAMDMEVSDVDSELVVWDTEAMDTV